MTTALIVVDVQNDFVSGTLAVPGAKDIIENVNAHIAAADNKDAPIFFTKDWHMPKHPSFKEQGGPWPPHCVTRVTPRIRLTPR